ncbi:hypothetical protein FEF22_000400 [Texas Phoenix palm phytoplasma]|uniref:Uncharacterized protein n=1 Tax=Texas Phoenix palm phytoplasma TaxID=176709 RepID=A0ABS5BI44_9MOLU|nr:hypothetical protein [Texas Phoenix palm phytoplasma]MBP3059250.1 hypothetical protein [Texas Phoenix palm phytoplasma]
MAWHDYTYLIGERVKVANEKEIGVVTRIDVQNGIICVLFKRMREVIYSYPESIKNETIKPFVNQN